MDHRLTPVHDHRLDLYHLAVMPDLLAQHRSIVEPNLDALRVTMARARAPDRKYLLVDEERLALMQRKIGGRRDPFRRSTDQRMLGFDRNLKERRADRDAVRLARAKDRDLAALH